MPYILPENNDYLYISVYDTILYTHARVCMCAHTFCVLNFYKINYIEKIERGNLVMYFEFNTLFV